MVDKRYLEPMHNIGDLVLFYDQFKDEPMLGVIKRFYEHGMAKAENIYVVNWLSDDTEYDYSSNTIEEFKADLYSYLGEE
jgi:predicted Mrr-cat superfamily restriction endonuclease